MWLLLTFAQLMFIWIVNPLAFAFYETDDSAKCCMRLWEAFRLQLPLWVVLVLLLVPTFFLANKVTIPEEECYLIDVTPNTEIDGEMYYVEENNFIFHAQAVTVIIG